MFSWTWVIIAGLLAGLMAVPFLESRAGQRQPAEHVPEYQPNILPVDNLRCVDAHFSEWRLIAGRSASEQG